jgi:predicted PurR-regulated permease PerM
MSPDHTSRRRLAPPISGQGEVEGTERSAFARKALMATGIGALVLTGLLFGWYAIRLLMLLFAGVLLAVLLDAPIRLLMDRTGISRSTAFGLVLTTLLSSVTLVVWLQYSNFAEQADKLLQDIPASFNKVVGVVKESAWGQELLEQGSKEQALEKAEQFIPQATAFISATVSGLMNLIIIGFIGLYIAADPSPYVNGLLRLVPPARRERVRTVLEEASSTLRWWLAARLVTMAIVGVVVGIGLWLLSVSLALMLGVLAALLDFVPLIGPILAALPALLLAGTQEPMLAVWVGLLYLGAQALENYVIVPLLQQRAVLIPPALLITMIVMFGTLQGILGVVLAGPLTAAGIVFVRRFYIEDVLGENTEQEAA